MDIIFDIDGTLANASHRLHYIKSSPKDWDSFLSEEEVSKDTFIHQTTEILRTLLLNPENDVLFITGRPERQRQMTTNWLLENAWPQTALSNRQFYSINRLFMRPNGDRRPSSVVKIEALERARRFGWKPTLVFEDRKDDTRAWREAGLLCAQVAEGDY